MPEIHSRYPLTDSTEIVVSTSSAPSKGSYSSYCFVSLLEVSTGAYPSSVRDRDVRRIIHRTGRLHAGSMVRSEAAHQVAYFTQLAWEASIEAAWERRERGTDVC